MSNIRLIISDIDGTILTSNHQVDEQLIEVMPELEKANIPFVLASARSPLGMQPIAHKLGLHDNPIACYNGALVLEGNRTIIEHPVDKTEIQELQKTLSLLKFKCWYYETAMKDGNEDTINAMLPDKLPENIQKLYNIGHE